MVTEVSIVVDARRNVQSPLNYYFHTLLHKSTSVTLPVKLRYWCWSELVNDLQFVELEPIYWKSDAAFSEKLLVVIKVHFLPA